MLPSLGDETFVIDVTGCNSAVFDEEWRECWISRVISWLSDLVFSCESIGTTSATYAMLDQSKVLTINEVISVKHLPWGVPAVITVVKDPHAQTTVNCKYFRYHGLTWISHDLTPSLTFAQLSVTNQAILERKFKVHAMDFSLESGTTSHSKKATITDSADGLTFQWRCSFRHLKQFPSPYFVARDLIIIGDSDRKGKIKQDSVKLRYTSRCVSVGTECLSHRLPGVGDSSIGFVDALRFTCWCWLDSFFIYITRALSEYR